MASPDFRLAGKVDGIVRRDGDPWLLEHKTTSYLGAAYLERLWIDFQILLYALYVREVLGIPVVGVVYNILVKARLRQGKAESDDAFAVRLAAKYAKPEMFHREEILLAMDRYDAVRRELWELVGAFSDARHRGVFYQNTDHCNRWGRSCEYLPLCRSGGNPNLIEHMYERRTPHEELQNNADRRIEIAVTDF